MVILHHNDMKHAFKPYHIDKPININQILLLLNYLKTSVNFNYLFYLLPNPWKYRMICAFYQIYFFCGTNQQYIKHIHITIICVHAFDHMCSKTQTKAGTATSVVDDACV